MHIKEIYGPYLQARYHVVSEPLSYCSLASVICENTESNIALGTTGTDFGLGNYLLYLSIVNLSRSFGWPDILQASLWYG